MTEEMMKEHLVFLPTQGYFKTKDGSVSDKNFTEVLKPTYYGEVLMNWASRSAEQSAGKVTEINNKFIMIKFKLSKTIKNNFQRIYQI